MIDCHVHIERGPYDLNWLKKFIVQGQQAGLSEIYILEHTHRFREFLPLYFPMSQYNSYQYHWLQRKGEHSVYEYIQLIELAKKQRYPITVKFGLEVCYDEAMEDFIEKIKQTYNWDFFTGAVHWVDGFAYDHKKAFWIGKNINAIYRRYYDLILKAIKSNLFTILAHPDAIKCFDFYPDIKLEDTYYRIAQQLNIHNMYAEESAGLHNNYSHRELGLNYEMRKIFIENNVAVLTGSDAHKPEDVGKGIIHLEKIMEETNEII
mgnify:CR=1 FL=1